MRMKKRTMIGFAACTLGVAISAATYAPARAAGSPGSASSGSAAASAPDQRQLRLARVADQIINLTRQGNAAGYSGYGDIELSVSLNAVTLYWHGAVPATLRSELLRMRGTAAVRVVPAPYTWRDLEAQTHRISGLQTELRARGIVLSRVGPLPGAVGVEAAVDPGRSPALRAARATTSSAVAGAMPALLAAAPAPVTVTTAPAVTLASTGITVANRNLDDSPWWGGDRIIRAGNVICSSGFSLINPAGHQFMLTAGHCGGINSVWYAGDRGGGPLMGTEVNRDSGGDTAIVAVNNNEGWIYDKGWNSTVGEQVIASGSAIRQESLCTEGATSGARCDAIVQQTGIDLPLGNGETAHNEVYATQKYGQEIAADGDSGGPVIANSGIPGEVIAMGTITGTTGLAACPSIDPDVVRPVCGKGVYFEDINAALNHWLANLYDG